MNDSTSTVSEPKPAEAPAWNPVSKGRGRPPKSAKKEEGGTNPRNVEAAWQGMWLVLRLLGRLFGFESDVDTLPDEEVKSDATALLPVVERHPALARVLGWIGAPFVIIHRVSLHFHKRAKSESSGKGSPAVNTGSGGSGGAPTSARSGLGVVNGGSVRPGPEAG